MDVNEYMGRTAEALELILKQQVEQTKLLRALLDNQTSVLANTIDAKVPIEMAETLKQMASEVAAGNAPAETASRPAASAGEAAGTSTTTSSEPAGATTGSSEPPASDAKPAKVTADMARAALKRYAATEGNDAAMELLEGLGAKSVTALAEQGEKALAKLIAKCEGRDA